MGLIFNLHFYFETLGTLGTGTSRKGRVIYGRLCREVAVPSKFNWSPSGRGVVVVVRNVGARFIMFFIRTPPILST